MTQINVVLPDDVWADVETGTEALVEDWLVSEGDSVKAGQPIANVVVVKSNHEVTAPTDGVVEKILVAAEDTFAPGTVLALLREMP
jgi:pyruvate/2-oxoglutarate dehydrogenase complex dihydrolipoamide acyltransferase (E2) component